MIFFYNFRSFFSFYLFTKLIGVILNRANDLEEEVIPRSTGNKMNLIKRKAMLIQSQIEEIEEKSGVSEDEEVDEKDVVVLLQLHKKLEKLKSEFDTLQNPILR